MLKETSFRSSSFSSCLACFLRSAPGGRGQGKGGGGRSHKPARRPHAFGGRVFTRCFRAELAHSPREPLRKEPHRKRGGGPSQMGEAPYAEKRRGGGARLNTHRPCPTRAGGSGAGCRPPHRGSQGLPAAGLSQAPAPHGYGAEGTTAASGKRASPAPRGGQREPGGGSALPSPSCAPGGPRDTQPPRPRRPQAPLAFPVVAAPRRHLCCPTSAAARRDRAAEKNGLERLPKRRGARRDGRTSSCSVP